MVKDGSLKVGTTKCDHCSSDSVFINPTTGEAFCGVHSTQKRASATPALKSVAPSLAEKHTAK